MLPISELIRLETTIGAGGRSGVADAVAARWGLSPGAATFWRSSGTHVFRVAEAAHGPCFLRFVPTALDAGLVAGATAADRLWRAGAAVAEPLRSANGQLVEVVATGLGRVTAMCVATAPGDTLDADTITDEQAAAWGAALARFHVAGQSIETSDLPSVPADGRSDETTVGLLHGDFELDNLHWNGDAVIAFDLDGVGVGSHMLDVAAAVRDLLDGGSLPEPSPRRTLLEAFFAGYSDVRPAAAFDALPRFVALDAAVRAARLRPIAAEQLPADAPAWARELQARVTAVIGDVSDVG